MGKRTTTWASYLMYQSQETNQDKKKKKKLDLTRLIKDKKSVLLFSQNGWGALLHLGYYKFKCDSLSNLKVSILVHWDSSPFIMIWFSSWLSTWRVVDLPQEFHPSGGCAEWNTYYLDTWRVVDFPQDTPFSFHEPCPLFHWALVHLQQCFHLTLMGFH